MSTEVVQLSTDEDKDQWHWPKPFAGLSKEKQQELRDAAAAQMWGLGPAFCSKGRGYEPPLDDPSWRWIT